MLCLLLVCVAPRDAAAAESYLRVITYNVAGGLVDDAVPLAVMLPQRPDLALLQEVRNIAHLAKLGQALGLPYGRFAPYSKRRGGIALLSRWPLGTARILPWRHSPQGKGRQFNGAPPPSQTRGTLALAAQVYSPAGRFWACSVHLDNPFAQRGALNLWQQAWLLGHELFASTQRTQEAIELSAWLLRLGGDNTILGGDFNSIPWARPDRYLRHHFADALAGSLGQYFSGTYWGLPHSPIRPRLDFIYHSPRWHVVEAQVIQHKASDHFPVLAVLSPPAEEREAPHPYPLPEGERPSWRLAPRWQYNRTGRTALPRP